MAMFAIWREFKAMTPVEAEAMQMLAVVGTRWVPVRWIRSFGIDLDGEHPKSLCIYEGSSSQQVLDHSMFCALPFSDIREVTEIAQPELTQFGPTSEGDLLLVTERGLADRADEDGAEWLRSFGAADGSVRLTLYRAGQPESIEVHNQDSIDVVSEVLPSNVAHLYDSMGIPRHWEECEDLVGDYK